MKNDIKSIQNYLVLFAVGGDVGDCDCHGAAVGGDVVVWRCCC